MTRYVVLALALFLSAPCKTGFAEDALDEKLDAARRYADVVHIDSMLKQTIEAAIQGAPANRREAVRQMLKPALLGSSFRRFMVTAMAEIFTLEEILVLTNFYGSPVGQSILRKMPRLMGPFDEFIEQQIKKTLAQPRQ